jgi:hypothetical protein
MPKDHISASVMERKKNVSKKDKLPIQLKKKKKALGYFNLPGPEYFVRRITSGAA